jgi:hypothetical protein
MDLIGIGQGLKKVAPCNGCSDASLTLDYFGDRKQRYRLLCLVSESYVPLTGLYPTLFV